MKRILSFAIVSMAMCVMAMASETETVYVDRSGNVVTKESLAYKKMVVTRELTILEKTGRKCYVSVTHGAWSDERTWECREMVRANVKLVTDEFLSSNGRWIKYRLNQVEELSDQMTYGEDVLTGNVVVDDEHGCYVVRMDHAVSVDKSLSVGEIINYGSLLVSAKNVDLCVAGDLRNGGGVNMNPSCDGKIVVHGTLDVFDKGVVRLRSESGVVECHGNINTATRTAFDEDNVGYVKFCNQSVVHHVTSSALLTEGGVEVGDVQISRIVVEDGVRVDVGTDVKPVKLQMVGKNNGNKVAKLVNNGVMNVSKLYVNGVIENKGNMTVSMDLTHNPTNTDSRNTGVMTVSKYMHDGKGYYKTYNDGVINIMKEAGIWKKIGGSGTINVYGDIYVLTDVAVDYICDDITVVVCGDQKQTVYSRSGNVNADGHMVWSVFSKTVTFPYLVINNMSAEGVNMKSGINVAKKLTLRKGVVHLSPSCALSLYGELDFTDDSWVDGLFSCRIYGGGGTAVFPVGVSERCGYFYLKQNAFGGPSDYQTYRVCYYDERSSKGLDDSTLKMFEASNDDYWLLEYEGSSSAACDVKTYPLSGFAMQDDEYHLDCPPDKGMFLMPYYYGKKRWTEVEKVELDTRTIPGHKMVLSENIGLVPGLMTIKSDDSYMLSFSLRNDRFDKILDDETVSDRYTWTGVALDGDFSNSRNWLYAEVPNMETAGDLADAYIRDRYSMGTIKAVREGCNDGKEYVYKVVRKVPVFPRTSTQVHKIHNLVVSDNAEIKFDGKSFFVYNEMVLTEKASMSVAKSLCVYGSIKCDLSSIGGTGILMLGGNGGASSLTTYKKDENTVHFDGTLSSSFATDGVELGSGVNLHVRVLSLYDAVLKVADGNYLYARECRKGSEGSHVDGLLYRHLPIAKSGSSVAYTYQIGNNGRCAYLTLTPSNAAQDGEDAVVGVRYYDSFPTSYAADNLDLYNSLDDGYWKIVAWPGSERCSVTSSYHYDDDNVCSSYDNDFTLGIYDGESWTSADQSQIEFDKGAGWINYIENITPGIDGKLVAFGFHGAHAVKRWKGDIDGDWSNVDNWAGLSLPDGDDDVLILQRGKYPTVFSGLAVANDLIMLGDTSKIVIDGGGLYVNGDVRMSNIDKPGRVVVNQRYDAMSSFKVDGEWTYDKAVVNRTFGSNVLYYVGSSTKESELSSGFGANGGRPGDYMAFYDVSTESYVDQPNGSVFAPYWMGCTIGLHQSADENSRYVTQIGTLLMKDNEFDLALSANPDEKYGDYGWNLLSNPNPFSYDLSVDGACSYSDNVSPVVWMRHFDEDSRKYYYTTYSLAARQGVGMLRNNSSMGVVAPHQAVFVRSMAPMQTFRFNSASVNSGNMVCSSSLKTLDVVDDVLRLSLSSDATSCIDEMAMVFRTGGSMSVTINDADKRMESDSYNQLYSIKDGRYFAIPLYPSIDDVLNHVFPLGVKVASGSTTAIIKAENIADFNDTVDAYLFDYVAGKSVNLRDCVSYSFNVDKGSINGRFAVGLYGKSQAPTSLHPVADCSDIMVAVDGGNIIVRVPSVSSDARMSVYNVSGRMVKLKRLSGVITEMSLPDLNGIYIIEVVNNGKTKKVKMMLTNNRPPKFTVH